ncbi:hypothetical protein ACFQ5D_24250, partial [Paenibacillus farraposensis]
MQTDRPFDYLIPSVLDGEIRPGMRVWVQFGSGKRQVSGMVVGLAEAPAFDGELKPILAV